MLRRIRSMEKPVVGAINGVAAGAGANIALACDLTVARESAPFIQAFSKIGLIPDSGGTWFLPRLVGMQRAAALAFLGDKLSATEAETMGLIHKAVADDAFEAEVAALAERLAQDADPGIGFDQTRLQRRMDCGVDRPPYHGTGPADGSLENRRLRRRCCSIPRKTCTPIQRIMTGDWIAVADRLPEDDQRVLAFIPGNRVFLPGKDLAFEIREVIVLRFCQDYFARPSRKTRKTRTSLLGWRRQ